MAAKLAVRGLKEVSQALREEIKGTEQAIRKWAYAEALEAMAFSQKIVPVDTGALRSSGFVEQPKKRGGTITVTLGYGGPAAPYAFKVHEDLNARHTEGQEAKFLEKGVMSREAGFADRLAEALRSF